MSKKIGKEQKKRLNLILGINVYKRIEKLRIENDKSSVTDVIRRSLAVYDFLLSRRKEGARIFVENEEGKQELVIL